MGLYLFLLFISTLLTLISKKNLLYVLCSVSTITNYIVISVSTMIGIKKLPIKNLNHNNNNSIVIIYSIHSWNDIGVSLFFMNTFL